MPWAASPTSAIRGATKRRARRMLSGCPAGSPVIRKAPSTPSICSSSIAASASAGPASRCRARLVASTHVTDDTPSPIGSSASGPAGRRNSRTLPSCGRSWRSAKVSAVWPYCARAAVEAGARAHGRGAPVGADDQRRLQTAAVVEPGRDVIRPPLEAGKPRRGHQRDRRAFEGELQQHAAQGARFDAIAERMIDDRGRLVSDPRAGASILERDGPDRFRDRREPWPQAERFAHALRAVHQCEGAAAEGSAERRIDRLSVDHRAGQAEAIERQREQQAGMPAAHDDDGPAALIPHCGVHDSEAGCGRAPLVPPGSLRCAAPRRRAPRCARAGRPSASPAPGARSGGRVPC